MKAFNVRLSCALAALSFASCLGHAPDALAQASAGGIDVAQQPLFTQSGQPPLNMLVMGKDHKIYYEAYNDASDLNGDGALDIVQAADKGGNESGACFGSQNGLRGGKTQCHIDHGAFIGQFLTDFQTCRGQRNFYRDILGDLGQLAAFFNHGVIIQRSHFGADRAADDRADFLDQRDKLFA